MFRALTFLGTSSGTPTLFRNVSGSVLSLSDGSCWLFDCGEGTQHQLLRAPGISISKIDKIFITHLHGDHCFGLPGLLCSISLSWRPKGSPADSDDEAYAPHNFLPFSAKSEYLEIYGPPQIADYVRTCLRVSGSCFGFKLRFNEAVVETIPPSCGQPLENEGDVNFVSARDGLYIFLSESGVLPHVTAGLLVHRVCSLGYSLEEPAALGALNIERALQLGVPKGPMLAKLKGGNDITFLDGNGTEICVRSEDIVGKAIPGRKLVVLGDTCDSTQLAAVARNADWLVHESTFSNEHASLAVPRGHSTAEMAGQFARQVKARRLLLTHFSARYPPLSKDPTAVTILEAEATNVFAGEVVAVEDFQVIDMSRRREK